MTRTVLVPHDLTELSDAALEAVGMLGPVDALHVVHVLPRIDLTHPTVLWPIEEDEPRRAHARAALEARLGGTPYENAVLHVVIGDPGTRIVELAREIEARLIVLPTHGRTGIERLLLGSVAEHVVRFASCPVLVLPAAALPPTLTPTPTTSPDATVGREDQVEALSIEILDRIARAPGQFLTAARIAVPDGQDPRWWEDAIERRLLDSGIEFVDLVIAAGPAPTAQILDLRFEERFV